MTITFTSIIKGQNDEDNRIQFTSELTMDKYNEFDVFEFLEPQNNIMNRIEVSDNALNIFAGPTTLNLELNQDIENVFETGQGPFILVANLSKLDKKENNVFLEYTLKSGKTLIGSYEISLEVK